MRTEKFDAESWVERLARALEGLASIQEGYRDELHWRDVHGGHGEDFGDPSREFQLFYRRISSSGSRFHAERYGPVRAALTETRGILSAHPAWAALVDAASGGENLVSVPRQRKHEEPVRGIGGLMARAKEVGEDGFRVACSELSLLLQPEGGSNRKPGRAELLTGYHVVLFQGLTVDEKVRIGADLTIVPFRHLNEFVDSSMLERLAPESGVHGGGNSVAAIIKRFRWAPGFFKDGESPASDGIEISSLPGGRVRPDRLARAVTCDTGGPSRDGPEPASWQGVPSPRQHGLSSRLRCGTSDMVEQCAEKVGRSATGSD